MVRVVLLVVLIVLTFSYMVIDYVHHLRVARLSSCVHCASINNNLASFYLFTNCNLKLFGPNSFLLNLIVVKLLVEETTSIGT